MIVSTTVYSVKHINYLNSRLLINSLFHQVLDDYHCSYFNIIALTSPEAMQSLYCELCFIILISNHIVGQPPSSQHDEFDLLLVGQLRNVMESRIIFVICLNIFLHFLSQFTFSLDTCNYSKLATRKVFVFKEQCNYETLFIYFTINVLHDYCIVLKCVCICICICIYTWDFT